MPTSGPFRHKVAAVCNGINGVTLVDLFACSHIQTVVGSEGISTCCCWNPESPSLLLLMRRNEYELLVGDNQGTATLFDIRKPGEKCVLGVLEPHSSGVRGKAESSLEHIRYQSTPIPSRHASPSRRVITHRMVG